MKIAFKDKKAALTRVELLVVLATKGEKPSLPKGVEVAAAVTRELENGFRECRVTDALKGPAKRVLFVGLGPAKELTCEKLRRAAAMGVKEAKKIEAGSVAMLLSTEAEKQIEALGAGQALAEGCGMAAYECTRFKSDPRPSKVKTVALLGSGAAFKKGVQRGDALAGANRFTRDLQDAPGNLMRPRDMVAAAKKLAAKSQRIGLKSLTEAEMKKLGMGSLLSVSRGSEEPAFLIHLTYKPKGRSKGKIAIVGKGLTFDAGGISIKPSAKMDEMKYDMSGGAAVLGLFHALANLDVPYEVHGLVPTSENLPDGKANKPGDIVTAMNKKTIEVLNTDAEGRLILADALAYAVQKIKPDTMIDMATLTGAVIVALGHELTGMVATSDELARALVAAGDETGELVWRLPMIDNHKDHIKGTIGDLRNINGGQGAGSTAGAAFLSHFVGDVEWAHLDIAGTAWGQDDRDYVGGSGGTGVGVRLLINYLENR